MNPVCQNKKCKSRNILYKKTTKSYWCRVCGHEWRKEKKNETPKYTG